MTGPLSTSVFAEKVAACKDRPSAVALLADFINDCGAKAGMMYSFDYGVQSAAERWTPLYTSFPREVSEYYARHRCIISDPFFRMALSRPTPIRYCEVAEQFDAASEVVEGMFSVMRGCGLRDGLAMHVSGRPGRMIYFTLVYDYLIDRMSEFEQRRIHACVEMFSRQIEDILEPEKSRELSPKERDVIACLARGESNKQIARSLGVSLSTVNTLVYRCFDKLGANTRTEAAITASRTGLALVA